MIFRELEKSQKRLLDSFKIKTRLEHNTQNTSEEEQSEIGMKGYVKGFLYTKISSSIKISFHQKKRTN